MIDKKVENGTLYSGNNYERIKQIYKNIYLSPLDFGDLYFEIGRRLEIANEIKADIVKEACPEGYLFIPGSLKDAKVLRLSAIVRKQLSYEVQEMECELPTLKIKTNGWTFVGYYREWRKGGRTECTVKESLYCLNKNPTPPKDTEDIRLQCQRFESFVSE